MRVWTRDGQEWQSTVTLEILEMVVEGVRRGYCKAQVRLTHGAHVSYTDAMAIDIGKTARENTIDIDARRRALRGEN